MTGQTCALPGCFKPRCPPSVRPGYTPPLTCGKFHHQLLMATRLNPDPYLAILHRNNTVGRCALSSCAELPHEGHFWCSRTHYLLWLAEFTSSLHREHHMCMLPGCTRHVYVDEDGSPPSRFCGWQHKQEFVRLTALQHRQQESLCPSVKVPSTQQQSAPLELLPASLNESEGGHLPSLNSRLHSLKEYAFSGTLPKDSSVVEDFYEKHPGEVYKGGEQACWVIARRKFKSKGLRQLTKGSYRWKQSGKPVKKEECTVKYYTYTRRKGKKKEDDHHEQHAENAYSMREFILEDVKSHSLHLVKGKPFSDGKFGKELPCNHQIADDQVDYACVQDMVTMSSCEDVMFVDNVFDGLLSSDNDLHRDYGRAEPYGLCQNGSADSDPPMFGETVAQAQVDLDMLTYGEGGLDSFDFLQALSA